MVHHTSTAMNAVFQIHVTDYLPWFGLIYRVAFALELTSKVSDQSG